MDHAVNSEFNQAFKEEIIHIIINYVILYNLFQKIEVEETFPTLFCEVIITLIPKPKIV